jgi:hypothetical protein
LNRALAAAGIFALTAGALVAGCSSSPSSTSTASAGSSTDCLFGVFEADVEVGIAHPTRSCASWRLSLAGHGITWYPINQLAKIGSPDDVDTDTMGETCDLTDGTQELFVEDGGEMPYGDGMCTKEEQAGWKPEPKPGPLAVQAQPVAASALPLTAVPGRPARRAA